MLNSQKLFVKNYFVSKWNLSPDWNTPTVNDISFEKLDNSLNSVTTDLSLILDDWLFITSSDEDSPNQGGYKISEHVSENKIILDSSFSIVEDEIMGSFVTITALICPIKFSGASFAYPNSSTDYFVEYSINPGYTKAISGILNNCGSKRQRSEGWIKFLFHSPTFYGDELIGESIGKLRSIFDIRNIGQNIRICYFEENAQYKDDQKDMLITSCVVEFKADFDNRSRGTNLELYKITQGFNYMNATVEQANDFIRFSGVHLNTSTQEYELTTLSGSETVSQIILDSIPDKFIIQNNGPVKFLSGHGLPVGQIAYLSNAIDSSHPNITFTAPVSGKIQRLFEVIDPFQISIGIGEGYVI